MLGCSADPEELLGNRPAEEFLVFPSAELVRVAAMPEVEAEVTTETTLGVWGGDRATPPDSARGWGKNVARDNIVVAIRDRGESSENILRELDSRGIGGLSAMKKRGSVRWMDGCQNVK